MNPQIQKWLVTGLAGLIAVLLTRAVGDWFMEEEPPLQRRLQDDIKEASLKAGTSLVATVIASVLVRRLLRSWQGR